MALSSTAQQRRVNIDALRGFSLFGILVVNITVFASTYYGSGVSDPQFSGPLNQAFHGLVALLFETKFYLLFSFLFGYSFTLQMQSAERAGGNFVPRMLRRQIGLWLFGAFHAIFLFHGDILTTYALLGVVLLAMRNQPQSRLLGLAAWLIIITALAWIVLGTLQLLAGETSDAARVMVQAEAARAAYNGSPATVIAQHTRELPQMLMVLAFLQGPCAFAMFLLGFVAGKNRLFERLEANQLELRRIRQLGLTVGLAGAFLYALSAVFRPGTGWETLGLGSGILTAPLLACAYGASAMIWFQSGKGKRVAAFLAPAGRMALSNYLLQSLVCSLIFTGFGFGLVGQLVPGAACALAVGIFAVQLVASRWWMSSHAYGPLEWLLRAITIAAWPAMRKKAVAQA